MNFHRTEFVFDCDFDCDCHCFFSKSRFLDCHNDVYTCFDDNISLPEVDHSIAFFLSLFFSLIFDIHFCVSPQIRTSDRFTKPIQSVIWFVIFFWVREGKRTENCSEIATITLHIVDCGVDRAKWKTIRKPYPYIDFWVYTSEHNSTKNT